MSKHKSGKKSDITFWFRRYIFQISPKTPCKIVVPENYLHACN